MDPRSEAFELLGRRYEVRVLEPSPPTVGEPPWFADDPVARGDVPAGREVVSPLATGDIRWEEVAHGNPVFADFCRERWLGPFKRLAPLPAAFGETRMALHAVAERVLKPTREQANGKFGLRFTRGGFGTPYFGAHVQLRVELDELVVVAGGEERRAEIDSLATCGQLLGEDLLAGAAELPADPLAVDPAGAGAVGDWFGFAASVLEQLRAEAAPGLAPSRVQLWPEHFDMAVELGEEASGARAGYGCSPGDEHHPEPYLYVAPWTARPEGELWNAAGFPGAERGYADLLAAPDQRAAALDFFRTRLTALAEGSR